MRPQSSWEQNQAINKDTSHTSKFCKIVISSHVPCSMLGQRHLARRVCCHPLQCQHLTWAIRINDKWQGHGGTACSFSASQTSLSPVIVLPCSLFPFNLSPSSCCGIWWWELWAPSGWRGWWQLHGIFSFLSIPVSVILFSAIPEPINAWTSLLALGPYISDPPWTSRRTEQLTQRVLVEIWSSMLPVTLAVFSLVSACPAFSIHGVRCTSKIAKK